LDNERPLNAGFWFQVAGDEHQTSNVEYGLSAYRAKFFGQSAKSKESTAIS
jgi:hypothetical protein